MKKYAPELIAMLLATLCFVNFRPQKSIVNLKSTKTIEKHIKGAEHIIEKKTVQINQDKSEIEQLNVILAEIQAKINQNKLVRDTFLLVQNQDEFIHLLQQKDSQHVQIILNQDTVINQLNSIIAGKDSIIYNSTTTNKLLKRQRNLLIVISSVLGGLLLIK